MNITTSNGLQEYNQEKLFNKIKSFTYDLNPNLKPQKIVDKVTKQITDGITTSDLDEITARVTANMISEHTDYSILASRILVSRLHHNLNIPNTKFVENLERLYNYKIGGIKSTRISKEVYDFAVKNKDELEKIVNYSRDYEDYDYFAIQGFMRRGLEKIDGQIAEVPSQMFLRVAIGLNVYNPRDIRELDSYEEWSGMRPDPKLLREMSDQQRLEQIKEYYDILSKRELSLPGPIIMHAGSEKNQMASCFLEHVSDSLTEEEYPITGRVGGIMKAITQLAKQSQGGAGTAISFSEIRANSSPIRSSNGKSNGILPFMKMVDSTIAAVNQSGKRAGVCAIYLEPWHADVLDFLDAANHFTIEEKRCKNIFYALWVNDIFFERLINDKQNAKWTLFDPGVVSQYLEKPLSDYYGEEFNQKYEYLESLGIGKTIPLMEVWSRALELFQTVGLPYILSKDNINKKTNQQNIGIVKSSNICTEITLHSNNDETAVCVLSSLCLSRFYDQTRMTIDYSRIIKTARIATRHLNNVIDLQYYPSRETRNSCLARRAIGVGAQGLADLFHLMKVDFASEEAKEVNKKIYECIYFGCMWESMELAKIEGSYTGFEGSPVSQGIFQHNMWGLDDNDLFITKNAHSIEILEEFGDNPWGKLKELVKKHGLRNSEVTAIAPTANASIRMSQNEMHEPFTRNVYVRQYIGGSIPVVNRYLVEELQELGLWNESLYSEIMFEEGSLQNIDRIPDDIKSRYRTVYELDWKDLVDMMADRSAFVSQSGSFNHYTSFEDASPTLFTQKVLYSWRKGLKSLSYYMHTETKTTAKKEFAGHETIKNSKTQNKTEEKVKVLADGEACNMEEGCEFCST
jgi:ribonucleoside-diphosphate reductase alpha chain